MKTTNDPATWGIKGGGFGLYGYLPALSKWQNELINIEAKHQASIEVRPELNVYQKRINWVQDEATLLKESTSLVLCVPPAIQQILIAEKISKKYRFLILEKPIATSPSSSDAILDLAISRAHMVRIGYSLRTTDWAKHLLKTLSNSQVEKSYKKIDLIWNFLAQHLKNKNHLIWKSRHSDGGGALRFYGIHLIAILSSIKNLKIVSSSIFFNEYETPIRWQALFEVNHTIIHIDVNSDSAIEQFSIAENSVSINHQNNPFSTTLEHSFEDQRIQFLIAILSSFNENNKLYYQTYKETIKLWGAVERTSKMIYSDAAR